MMLEIAIGDAYGAGFEYVDQSITDKENDLSHYHEHSKYCLGNGKYTDDTQMSIAIAEMISERKSWTHQNIADKFVEVFKRDEREGYASGFYEFLKSVNSGDEFISKIRPDSEKSGAVMRASPIGYMPNINLVKNYSCMQAQLTHNTQLGINSAIASALMSHYFIYILGEKKDLGNFIEKHVPGNWTSVWRGRVGQKGVDSTHAAISSIMKYDSLSSLLKGIVDLGGDVDTAAAIALGAASCSLEIKKDLPQVLVEGLENGEYGRDYLIKLDQKVRQEFFGRSGGW